MKTDSPIELGCVGQHLYAIKPTEVSQHALLHPSFSTHSDFPYIHMMDNRIVKDGETKTLDSFQVIWNLYYNRQKMLTSVTLQNAPTLLNNKYADITSMNKLALNERWFRPIGLTTKDGETTGYKYVSYPFTHIEDIQTLFTRKFSVKNKYPLKLDTVYFDLERSRK